MMMMLFVLIEYK